MRGKRLLPLTLHETGPTALRLIRSQEDEALRVKRLAQGHSAMSRSGLEPESSDPESSALTT